ncbi:hypothetical protein J6500_24240 [Bradyrhizobium sp. WSM 1704]|uniref:hypothetical protein n=1 Tax=Bradyrhizobium semiaridum TaxID=2821404 RepID=UPI001CE334A0|nr:hypothetical protein [Bradyrhizobium semiaridum]MCA6124979.1 hypothetical protein [Bradyrhizobium semiaridum]
MASHDLATIDKSRPAGSNTLQPAAPVKASLALAALLLGVVGAVAHADNTTSEPRPPAPVDAQRTAQNPPPARVILPAPWEPATATPSATAQAATTSRK